MAHLKKGIVEVKADDNCLAHALIIAIASVHNESNYKSYHDGWKIRLLVQNLIKMTCIDLTNGAGFLELARSQKHFGEYKILVYQAISCDNVMFERQVESSKRINLIYDEVDRHHHVIINPTSAMARRYVCRTGKKSCISDATHICFLTCSDCMTCPPCAFESVK